MKKLFTLAIIAIMTTTVVKANDNNGQSDTIVRYNQKTIQISDSVGQVKVMVFGNDSTPYNKIYEGIFTDGKSSEKWTVMEDLGIDWPIIKNLTHKKKVDRKMEAHWAGIGWGFANISDLNYVLNNIDGVSLKSELSNEFYINLIEKILPIYRNNLGITSGLGMSWHNYFLDNNKHLLEVNDITGVYDAPVGVNYESSRLRVFQINVPLFLEWQPTFGKNHKLFVTAGIVGGINTSATYRVKYLDSNSHKVNMVESKGLNIAPLSLDYMAQIGYGAWSVYAKYSPFSMFQSEKGPDVRAVSLGATLNF
jgi:hypothetical protein